MLVAGQLELVHTWMRTCFEPRAARELTRSSCSTHDFALAHHIAQADLDRLDLLRRTRHLAEYADSATTITEPDASAAIQLAHRVLASVKKAMTSPGTTS